MTIHVLGNTGASTNIHLRKGDIVVGRWGDPARVVSVTNAEVKLRCPTHGVFTRNPASISRKCEDCPREATTNNFIAKATSVHSRTYLYRYVVFKNSKEKVRIECRIHGVFEQEPRLHLSGKGCPTCGRDRQKESLSYSNEQRAESEQRKSAKIAQLKKKRRRELWQKLLTELASIDNGQFRYKPLKAGRLYTKFARIKAVCLIHNTETIVETTAHKSKPNKTCAKCVAEQKAKKRSIKSAERRRQKEKRREKIIQRASFLKAQENAEKLKELKRLIRERHGRSISLKIFTYSGLNETSTAVCKRHGPFTISPFNLRRAEFPCRQCMDMAKSTRLSKASTKDTEHFIKLSRKLHKDRYTYENSEYRGKKHSVTVTCRKHGDFEIRAGDHMHKKTNYGGCPDCRKTVARGGSLLDAKVRNFVNKLGFATTKDRKVLKPYEIDILVESKKFGIEINGEYWHSSKFRKPNYHVLKAQGAQAAGITLYQFWYKEVTEKAKIVKSMIRSALGVSSRVYARQTEVRRVGSKERREFFENCHLQGDARATIAYGLYADGILVACMSFGKPRFSKKYQWEIIRFANALNLSVVGGASKLWSKFVSDVSPKSVLTYADRRYSTGSLYKILGFTEIGNTPPNYFWHNKTGEVFYRYETQKHKLKDLLEERFDDRLTEVENMERAHSYRVFDAGHVRLVWHSK